MTLEALPGSRKIERGVRSMASRVPDQTEDGQGGEVPADGGRPTTPGRRPGTDTSGIDQSDDKKSESEKAETDIAAGDVADDLA